MGTPQAGIIDLGCRHHLVQQFTLRQGVDSDALRSALRAAQALEGAAEVDGFVLALRPSVLALLGGDVPSGVADFVGVAPAVGDGPAATQDDVLVWFQSTSPEENLLAAVHVRTAMAGVGDVREETAGFTVRDHRDLTGFEDGTENPEPDEVPGVALFADDHPLSGGSVVFAQRWVHDLAGFDAISVSEQEQVIGRTKPDSVELDPLPDASHVERMVIADESGEERAIYRRSFPFGSSAEAGLFFLALTNDRTVVDEMLARMYGADGPRDRLLAFSTAVSGAYYIAPSAELLEGLIRG